MSTSVQKCKCGDYQCVYKTIVIDGREAVDVDLEKGMIYPLGLFKAGISAHDWRRVDSELRTLQLNHALENVD